MLKWPFAHKDNFQNKEAPNPQSDLLLSFVLKLINREDLVAVFIDNYNKEVVSGANAWQEFYTELYFNLETFITKNEQPVVVNEFNTQELRSHIANNIEVGKLIPEIAFVFYLDPEFSRGVFGLGFPGIKKFISENFGANHFNEILSLSLNKSIKNIPEMIPNYIKIYDHFYKEISESFGVDRAKKVFGEVYEKIKEMYGYDLINLFLEVMPNEIFKEEKIKLLSRDELEKKVAEATKADKERLVTSENLYRELKTRTSQIEAQNKDLENTKLAMVNLLEDEKLLEEELKLEKTSVEAKIVERTGELSAEKAKLSASIEALLKAFVMIDLKENVVLTNQNVGKLFGEVTGEWSMGKLQGKLGASFDLVGIYKKYLETKERFLFDDVAFGPRFLEIRISPVFQDIDQKQLIGVLAIIGDITEEKILARSKDEFFSIASHELRTPLTAIKGNTSMIRDFYQDKIKDPELNEMINDIHESSVRLIGIVNDFLDMSRLEQGKIEFKKEAIDVPKMIEGTIKEFITTGSEKKLSIEFHPGTTKLPLIWADIGKAKEILINLIGNGLKFTEKGGITVTADIVGNLVKVFVSDTGRGISPENQNLLFHKFQQANTSLLTRDTTKGTGLGLYISKLMVEAMGGAIKIESSEVGKGTVFSFTLPVATPEQIKAVPKVVVQTIDSKTGLSKPVATPVAAPVAPPSK